MRRLLVFIVAGVLSLGVVSAAWAEPVLVTVTGAVDKANRGGRDDFADALFVVHDIAFDKARAFTRLDLAALGQRDTTVAYDGWPRPASVRGPRLADVLAAAGAPRAGTVIVQALDGYSYTLPLELAEATPDMILAIEADGKALSIGGRGPTWLVFPPGLLPGQEGDHGLVWAAFHLRVDPPGVK